MTSLEKHKQITSQDNEKLQLIDNSTTRLFDNLNNLQTTTFGHLITNKSNLSFQNNYFLQCNATAADSSQSNVSRLYILKKQKALFQNFVTIFENGQVIMFKISSRKTRPNQK